MRRTVLTTTAAAAVLLAVRSPLAVAAPSVTHVVRSTKTTTGKSVVTPYGAVQVRITSQGHDVVKAVAVHFPNDNPHSTQINSFAIPRLDQEAVKHNSAHIQAVSGATYTSAGYKRSLQSALNRAGI